MDNCLVKVLFCDNILRDADMFSDVVSKFSLLTFLEA